MSGDCRPRPCDGRALGRAANGRLDDDARKQSLPAIGFRGSIKHVRRRTSLPAVQSHCRREKIREKVRSRLADAKNGVPARYGKIRSDFAKAFPGFFAGKNFR